MHGSAGLWRQGRGGRAASLRLPPAWCRRRRLSRHPMERGQGLESGPRPAAKSPRLQRRRRPQASERARPSGLRMRPGRRPGCHCGRPFCSGGLAPRCRVPLRLPRRSPRCRHPPRPPRPRAPPVRRGRRRGRRGRGRRGPRARSGRGRRGRPGGPLGPPGRGPSGRRPGTPRRGLRRPSQRPPPSRRPTAAPKGSRSPCFSGQGSPHLQAGAGA
mmetsp:Transcript_12882/g.36492  ORF Transcript_12882/g.36492 Transcript_12882/m.36492 type:complete len:215 (-) Transcript_12882:23-667(-)